MRPLPPFSSSPRRGTWLALPWPRPWLQRSRRMRMPSPRSRRSARRSARTPRRLGKLADRLHYVVELDVVVVVAAARGCLGRGGVAEPRLHHLRQSSLAGGGIPRPRANRPRAPRCRPAPWRETPARTLRRPAGPAWRWSGRPGLPGRPSPRSGPSRRAGRWPHARMPRRVSTAGPGARQGALFPLPPSPRMPGLVLPAVHGGRLCRVTGQRAGTTWPDQ